MNELNDLEAALAAANAARRARDAARERLTREDTAEYRAALEAAEGRLREHQNALEPLLDAARGAIRAEAAEVQRRRESLDREIVSGDWSKPLNDLISDREALLLQEQQLTGKTRAEIGPLPARAQRA